MKTLIDNLLPLILFLTAASASPGILLAAAGRAPGEVPPVKFIENPEVSLGFYPEGFQSAAAVAVTGLDLGEDNLQPLERLVSLLANRGIRATFFVSAGENFRKNITEYPHRLQFLLRFSRSGFEIAQDSAGGLPAPPPPRRWEEIKENRRYLTGLGFAPEGWRGYDSGSTGALLPLLDKLGYGYLCLIPPRSVGGAIRQDPPPYPEDCPGLRILQYSARLDPIGDFAAAQRCSGELAARGGVMVCRLALTDLAAEEDLDRMKRLIDAWQEQNSWICSLEKLNGWWLARREVEIRTHREEETLVMVYDNPTRFPLRNARLLLKELSPPARYYRLESRQGLLISSGVIPESGFLNATLIPSPDRPAPAIIARTGREAE